MDSLERIFIALVGFQQDIQRRTLGININNENKIAFSSAIISEDIVSVENTIDLATKNNVIKSLMKQTHDLIINNNDKNIDMFISPELKNDNTFIHFVRHNPNINIIKESDLTTTQKSLVKEYSYTAQREVKHMIKKYYEKKSNIHIPQIPHMGYKECIDIEMRKRNTVPFYVATDATRDPLTNTFFVSCVTQDGEIFTESIQAKNIAEAESFGVMRAVERYSSRNVNLVVFTDSQSTYIATQKLMKSNRRFKDHQNSLVKIINDRNTLGHLITIKKVKGHSGHILNTAADESVCAVRKHAQGVIDNNELEHALNHISESLKRDIESIK